MKSDLQRHLNFIVRGVLSIMLYAPVNGAYTELFAGLAPEVAKLKEGEWVIPFGRIAELRKDFVGGNGKEFWEWSEEQVGRYV